MSSGRYKGGVPPRGHLGPEGSSGCPPVSSVLQGCEGMRQYPGSPCPCRESSPTDGPSLWGASFYPAELVWKDDFDSRLSRFNTWTNQPGHFRLPQHKHKPNQPRRTRSDHWDYLIHLVTRDTTSVMVRLLSCNSNTAIPASLHSLFLLCPSQLATHGSRIGLEK